MSKLFKEPLTNWQSAATKFEQHQKHSLIHRDSMLRLAQFKSVMMGATKGIDEQTDTLRSTHIQYNRSILSTITKTVILAGRQNVALRGHRDDSRHYTSTNPGNFQAFLNYRVDGGDRTQAAFSNGEKECYIQVEDDLKYAYQDLWKSNKGENRIGNYQQQLSNLFGFGR